MVRSRVPFLALAVTLFAACEADGPVITAPTGLAPANTVKTNEKVPVQGTTVNTCNGETVEVSGFFHLVTTTTTEGTTQTMKIHLNTQGIQGVGLTTGAKYNFIAKQTAFNVTDTEPPFAFVQDVETRIHTVSQGNIDNHTLEQTVHFEFDGTTFTSTVDEEMRCVG